MLVVQHIRTKWRIKIVVRHQVMQTTIPYLDAQPVAPSTGTWLSGMGIYHKGSPGYGGYIGLIVK